MAEYKLTPEFLVQVRKRFYISGLPLIFIALLGGFFAGGKGLVLPPLFLAILILLMVLSVGSGILRGFRQQKKAWSSYRLFLEGDQLRRTQEGLPEVQIKKEEITKIFESAGRGMTVRAASPARQIHIPATLENYDEVCTQLAGWRSFQEVSSAKAKWNSFLSPAAGIAVVVVFVTVYSAQNRIVVVSLGSLLCITLGICLILIQKSGEIPAKTKRASWIILLPLLSIGMKVWFTLTGH